MNIYPNIWYIRIIYDILGSKVVKKEPVEYIKLHTKNIGVFVAE